MSKKTLASSKSASMASSVATSTAAGESEAFYTTATAAGETLLIPPEKISVMEVGGGGGTFMDALRAKRVVASVRHLDHYRTRTTTIGTDYIILVQPFNPPDEKQPIEFEPFTLSKTFKSIRNFSKELTHIADTAIKTGELDIPAARLAKYVDLVANLVSSQPHQITGKITFAAVQRMAKARSQVINSIMEATCEYFPAKVPSPTNTLSDIFISDICSSMTTFFLTDHVMFNGIEVDRKPELQKDAPTENHVAPNPILRFFGQGAKKVGAVGVEVGKGVGKGAKKMGTEVGKDARKMGTEANKAFAKKQTDEEAEASKVVPLTVKDRRSEETRALDEATFSQMGENAALLLHDVPHHMHDSMIVEPHRAKEEIWLNEYTSSNTPQNTRPQKEETAMVRATSWWLIGGFVVGGLLVASRLASIPLQVDADIASLIMFGCFCLGLHVPRKVKVPPAVNTVVPDKGGRRLLERVSMLQASTRHLDVSTAMKSVATEEVVQDMLLSVEMDTIDEKKAHGTMQEFPKDAKIGTVPNCWSTSPSSEFSVRGPNYLKDKKKVPSDNCMFPLRGVDLFLTDTCPSNVASNPAALGGELRDSPTFVINFKMPWGVLPIYCEIPEKFCPYVQAGYEPDAVNMDDLNAKLKSMTAGERCLCRFLMSDTETKNKKFKIIPKVVQGPWVVKQVVGGRPALVGNKLPIEYTYQKAENGKALYLEADLDIAASAAARNILSVTKSYTQVLTLDLGFLVEGQADDELPEQMLLGCRLHGIDPLTAQSYPPNPHVPSLEYSVIASTAADDLTSEMIAESIAPLVAEENEEEDATPEESVVAEDALVESTKAGSVLASTKASTTSKSATSVAASATASKKASTVAASTAKSVTASKKTSTVSAASVKASRSASTVVASTTTSTKASKKTASAVGDSVKKASVATESKTTSVVASTKDVSESAVFSSAVGFDVPQDPDGTSEMSASVGVMKSAKLTSMRDINDRPKPDRPDP